MSSPTSPSLQHGHVFSMNDACWPCSSWWESTLIPNLSEDNETGLQKCANPTELQTHLSLIWYQLLKKGAKLSEVQLEQQFDRPNFVFPQVHHLDW